MFAVSAAYTKREVLLFLGAFFATAVACYATIIFGSTAVPAPLSTPMRMFSVIFGLLIVLPIALLIDVKIRRIRVILYGLIHIVAGGIVLLYIGSYNPMTATWLVLAIVTFLEFGTVGFIASSAFLYAFSILFCSLVAPLLPYDYSAIAYTFYSLVFCTVLIVTAYVITRVINSGDKRRHELELVRRAESAQLNKMGAILNSISEAILTLDSDMRITSQNAAALAFFDTNETLIGRKITDILKIVNDKLEPINVKSLVAGVTHSIIRDDVIIENSDQGNMRLSLQMSPIYADNRRQGVVMVIADITKQKTLEDEKDEFISVASHELRTPIAIAEGSLSNMVIMQEKNLDPKLMANAAAMAHDQVVYLAGVVNDLSTLSRAERGVADTPEPVDMDELFHNLYTKYGPDAAKKSLQFDLDLKGKLPVVEVSRLYVEEILQNLITNAIKYTQTGTVTLMAKETPEGVECAVHDSGIGISKSDQKHMFERFWRSEDYRTRETNGTGLGLYVVAKLAVKIGTKIIVESRLNHGSTFSLVVPFKSSTSSTGKRSNVDEK